MILFRDLLPFTLSLSLNPFFLASVLCFSDFDFRSALLSPFAGWSR